MGERIVMTSQVEEAGKAGESASVDRPVDRTVVRPGGWRDLGGRAMAGLGIAAIVLLLSACGSLFEPGQPMVWYQLEDRPAAREARPAAAKAGELAVAPQPPTSARSVITPAPNQTPPGPRPRLMLSALNAGALYESTGIVYGRALDQRAYYQYANWAERPSNRLVSLLDVRLNERLRNQAPAARDFAWIAVDTSGLIGDWLLGLRIKAFYHDASGPQDRAIVEIDAELLDWQAKALLARRIFRAEQPLATSTVTAAVSGLSEATSQVLDQIVVWLEALTPPKQQ